ncbi:MAG: isoprenylcysteine carboxylmethyltransferase family protein [Sphingomonadaceae bacterium]|nr:isoprenylcysteine carboxylmethyltransferase family protein [Sphingomonadaceae bacterium]
MARAIYLLFGFAAYLIFFATFLVLIGFVADYPGLPWTVDLGPAASMPVAIAIDLALIALFGVQHSVMARPAFKAAWTRIVPEAIERSLYVLLASLCLILLYLFWRPLPAVLWSVANPAGAYILWALFGLGWLIVLVSTFLLNHFELFGLQQVWSHGSEEGMPAPEFRTPLFYKHVRHPLYSGFVLAFWATPLMTVGHALLAAGMTVYILIAIVHEERDLVGLFGQEYRDYRQRAGMLIPKFGGGG